MQEEIVRSDACLAAVQALAPGNAAGGDGEVGVLVHDARTLSAQFQHHGREVLGLRRHGYAAQGRAAGKEHQVVAVPEQFAVHHTVPLHHGHILLTEGIGNELLYHLGDVGHIRGGFQDGGTTGRYAAHQGVQQQLYGVVPGAHDKGAAQGFAHDVAGGGQAGERGGTRAAAGPSACLGNGFPNFPVNQAYLCHEGFLITFVKVFPEGLAKGFLPFLEACVEGFQLADTPLDVSGGTGSKERPLFFYELRNALGRGIFQCHSFGF